MTEKNDDKHISLEKRLLEIAHTIYHDKFMLMEYLGPVVDGCRAALNVNLEDARNLHQITDEQFEEYMQSTMNSYRDISICFKVSDTNEEVTLVFDKGKPEVFDECIEPDVTIVASEAVFIDLLDSDSKTLPTDLIGEDMQITGDDSLDVVQGLGLLCYPALLRVARSGIDPSSLLSEDADAIIMATTSDLVIKMVRKWIDLQMNIIPD
ncbi:MAG: hypothetical protein JW779_03035 [Candidatus Thorarchaeota archaeon]|nr:hypothetical protein [Candidatus Thorarchaeota archaeon]